MHLRAGVEPLIVIGIMIASAIYQAIAKRKQDNETWAEWDQPSQPPLPPQQPVPPVIPTKALPQPRAIVRQAPVVEKAPPPLPRPVIIHHDHEAHEGPDLELARLEQSQSVYARAANLQQRVETRLTEIDRQTVAHVPAAVRVKQRPVAAQKIVKSFQRPETIQQAFLASFVLNPPKALE
jgi:hypothetical protein